MPAGSSDSLPDHTKICIYFVRFLQIFDLLYPRTGFTPEVLFPEVDLLKKTYQFLPAAVKIPFGFEIIFEYGENFLETYPIGTGVTPMFSRENKVTPRNGSLCCFGKVPNCEVPVGDTYVERFTGYKGKRCFQPGNERTRDITDMNDRAPWSTVT